MARKMISIEEKIERQKQIVSKFKARYEAELEVLDKLMQIRDEELDKELLIAFRKSGLSHQDAIKILAKGAHHEDEEENES